MTRSIICASLLMTLLLTASPAFAQALPSHPVMEAMRAERIAAIRSDAEAGDAHAQYWLASIHHSAPDPEIRDLHEAARWYELAAMQGIADAQMSLAMFYSGGIGGLPVDCAKSIEWYGKAAENGIPAAWANVAWKLATCDDEALRDGPRALALLQEHAEEFTEDASTLDTMAAVHAELADFERATALQVGAIALLEHRGQEERLEALRERLRLYQLRQTWKGASFANPAAYRE